MNNELSWTETQKQFYNARDHKRMWFSPSSAFVRNILSRFIPFAGIKSGLKILEIGCGAGRYSIPLIQSGYHVTGVDVSERMLKKFREDADRAGLNGFELLCDDIDHFCRSGRGKFDAVIGFNVLHHLDDVAGHLQKLSGCLSSGGCAAFVEPNAGNFLHTIDTLLDRGWKAEGNKSKSMPENVTSALKQSGFDSIEYERFGFFPPIAIDSFPGLVNFERFLEQKKTLENILPYFMVKGTKTNGPAD